MWTKHITCHFSKQRMLHPKAVTHCSAPDKVPMGIQEGEKQDTGPKIVQVRIEGMISVSPNSSIFPNIEKHQNH